MKIQIPQFLKENFTNQNARPKFFPDDMKQFILDYGRFYDYPNTKNLEGNQLLSLWFRYMKSGINEIGICAYDECNEKQAVVNDSKSNGFKVSNCCSWKHSNKLSLQNKYGVENVFQLDSIKEKSKITLKRSLGVENPSQSDLIKDKKKETLIRNYGVDHNTKSKIVIQRRNEHLIKKYGTLNLTYNTKEYKWKTGEISLVQGYENIILSELEDKGYTFKDIITDDSKKPKFFYKFNGKAHRYYPDIYIPNENLIIEVKSDWTLKIEYERNQAKFQSVKDAGFEFKLEVR